jgi:hypothetical protein
LWDRKGNNKAGVWLEWRTRALAFWLLQDTGYSLRDTVVNLFNVMLLQEFDKKVVAIVNDEWFSKCKDCGAVKWFQKNQYERICQSCGCIENWNCT